MRRLTLLALTALLLLPTAASADAPPLDRAGDYLAGRLGRGGCAAEPNGTPTPQLTAWVALGLVASGRSAGAAATCIAAHAAELRAVTDVELAILALVAADRDPRDVGGRDLVAAVLAAHRNGRIGTTVASNQFGILALRAAGSPFPASARTTLLRDQGRDGTWPVARGGDGDSNLTASGIAAAIAAGVAPGDARIGRAVAALRRFRSSAGGYALTAGSSADAQSTGWVLSGLAGAKRSDPTATRWLAGLQQADGSIAYQRGVRITPVWVTAQAAMGLAGRSFPLRP